MRVALAGLAACALYLALLVVSDLKGHAAVYLIAHGLLVALMLVARRGVASGDEGAYRTMLVGAIVFRLIAAGLPPTLSDDVYRYVWDGRVQAAGHHPYRFAPADPARSELRDDIVYPRINHPEIPTIYPPLAEMLFAILATAKLGVLGFKLAFAALDIGVVLALAGLLAALGRPRDRVVFYAWNPLAIFEVAGSGHMEPLAILLLVLALWALVSGKGLRAGAALGAAIQAKLFPLLVLPGFARRMRTGALLVLVAVVAITTAPYALRGPWVGAGIVAYAHRWEHGAVLFVGVRKVFEWLDAGPHLKAGIAWAQARWGTGDTAIWDALYRLVWPQELARLLSLGLIGAWAVFQSFRRQPDIAQEARLVIGGALLLSPTLHPWYLLWVLPLAAADASGGWLVMAALVPLQYLSTGSDVSWGIRLAILVPSVAWMAAERLVRSRR